MIETLLRDPMSAAHAKRLNRKITQEEYDLFNYEYPFDALRDVDYGKAFCKRFGIVDYNLFYSQDYQFSCKIIDTTYLQK
jgi:hypothetical protein